MRSLPWSGVSCLVLFFDSPTTTDIYTLSLHDALPICHAVIGVIKSTCSVFAWRSPLIAVDVRSEEHTSELQSRVDLVCRLLLEKKKSDTYTSCSSAQSVDGSREVLRASSARLSRA